MPKLNLTSLLALLEGDPSLAGKLLTPAAILGLLKLYTEYQKDAADGFLSAAEGFQLASDLLGFLAGAGFTVADLQKLVEAVQPLFAAK